jgi:uncharacterized protein with NRDE domain
MTLENGTVITAPRDTRKGGTWIAMDENGRSACLFNGAYIKHIRQPKYRKSRGHFVFEAFESSGFDEFLSEVDPGAVEPFTLLLIEPKRIRKLIWDGSEKHLEKLSGDEVHLWSSATLYTPKEHKAKYAYFMDALDMKGSESEQILRIHGKDIDTPFVIDHPQVKTVSITQLQYDGRNSELTYILKRRSNDKAKSIPHTFDQP